MQTNLQDEENVVLANFAGAAAGYFSSIRIPATLITGTSLGFLFAFTKVSLQDKSYLQKVVIRSYHACVISAFGLALTTIVVSTSASVSMLHGRFDPYATTAYEMMRREFDFEFSVTRWCFLVALLAFLVAVTDRIILEFDLLSTSTSSTSNTSTTEATNNKRQHLYAIVSFMTAIAANLLSYINRTMYCWNSLWGLTVHVMHLLWQSVTVDMYPLQMLSFVAGIVAVFFMTKIIFLGGTKEKKD